MTLAVYQLAFNNEYVLAIPLHLKRVATPYRQISVFKIFRAQDQSGAICRARLSHSKLVEKTPYDDFSVI